MTWSPGNGPERSRQRQNGQIARVSAHKTAVSPGAKPEKHSQGAAKASSVRSNTPLKRFCNYLRCVGVVRSLSSIRPATQRPRQVTETDLARHRSDSSPTAFAQHSQEAIYNQRFHPKAPSRKSRRRPHLWPTRQYEAGLTAYPNMHDGQYRETYVPRDTA